MSVRSKSAPAFTLVELLVVIGIIAVLISVLLPSLNKARQAAHVIDCQSRLRQMGQALHIYAANNNGLLPWGAINRQEGFISPTWTASNSDAEPIWWWHFTLSQVMNPKLIGNNGLATNHSPVFRDRDTIDTVTEPRYVNHYTVNERVMWSNHDVDSAPSAFQGAATRWGNTLVQRKLASVKPVGVFVIWDAPQIQDYDNNAYQLNTEMDANQLTFGHFFVRGKADYAQYARPVIPGWFPIAAISNPAQCKVFQKKYNVDLRQAFNLPDGWLSHLRFRHMNNTSLNALCLDGHVESRKVGEAMLLDFCTNYPY